MKSFEKVNFMPADILIPKGIDMEKWSVVACDQYTSQLDYWQETKALAGNSPSTLNIILPEIYLEQANADEKIADINKTMHNYLKSGLFKCYDNSFIYTERKLPGGKVRKGLIGAIDLEAYNYKQGSKSNIRATEKTVIDRIPPRVNIRCNAPLEAPHVMLLIDDAQKTVIEGIEKSKDSLDIIYSFNLMQNGGSITGYHVPAAKANEIASNLLNLMGKSEFLYAVGDGNHSLAAAKECWEMQKKSLTKSEMQSSNARYALVELVNLHDSSLIFEPIHRIVFGCDVQDILNKLSRLCENRADCPGTQPIKCTYQGKSKNVFIKTHKGSLPLSVLQKFLDEYAASNNCKIDYIHGDDVVNSLSSEPNNIGFILPSMQKQELFCAVAADGALPRKTFSMGSANEKRYYLECRKII